MKENKNAVYKKRWGQGMKSQVIIWGWGPLRTLISVWQVVTASLLVKRHPQKLVQGMSECVYVYTETNNCKKHKVLV